MSEPLSAGPTGPEEPSSSVEPPEGGAASPRPKRRRGSRGGRNRNRNRTTGAGTSAAQPDELPERPIEGRPKTVEAAERALVRKPDPNAPKPKIGDSRPAPDKPAAGEPAAGGAPKKRRRRGGRGRGSGSSGGSGGGGGGGTRPSSQPVRATLVDEDPLELDDEILEQRRGRERKGRPLGRYLM